MYAKSGSVQEAEHVSNDSPQFDVFCGVERIVFLFHQFDVFCGVERIVFLWSGTNLVYIEPLAFFSS